MKNKIKYIAIPVLIISVVIAAIFFEDISYFITKPYKQHIAEKTWNTFYEKLVNENNYIVSGSITTTNTENKHNIERDISKIKVAEIFSKSDNPQCHMKCYMKSHSPGTPEYTLQISFQDSTIMKLDGYTNWLDVTYINKNFNVRNHKLYDAIKSIAKKYNLTGY